MFYKAQSFTKIIFILVLFAMFLFFSGGLKSPDVLASDEDSDAIAVRILPNEQHYSPMTWYRKQGFSGSPKPLEVDGYDAIQDGRTVYVNVANISSVCSGSVGNVGGNFCSTNADCPGKAVCLLNSEALYTNIYLISYNQDSSPSTISIFNKILEKWKFNTNMAETGHCFPEEKTTVCLVDSDCVGGNYCDSLKAQVTRDIKRLASVVEMREAVEIYRNINNFYPKLSAGTYLPGRTISTWPSWQTTFSSAIGMIAPLDPINKLGDCGGSQYDETTCWDQENKTFAGSIPHGMPGGSNALVYSADDNGESYELCALMESGQLVGGEWGNCIGNTADNNVPEVTCGSLSGIVGEKFSGFVSGFDADGDSLTVSLSGLPSGFTEKSTANPSQKEVYSDSATIAANGDIFSVTVSDGKSQTSKDCTIDISSESFITYPIPNQKVVIGNNFNTVIYANHTKREYDGMTFIFEETEGKTLPSELSCIFESLGPVEDGRYQCRVNYTPSKIETYSIRVYARNGAGAESTKQIFTFEAYNNPPVMNSLNCDTSVRKGAPGYECIVSASDPDGHKIVSYSPAVLSSGMNLSFLQDTQEGRISGVANTAGIYDISITARDQFGATSQSAGYTLQVNTFCGDGEQNQNPPNMEARGGPGQDGKEDCDDGNDEDGDGCNTISNNCTFTCGDGYVSTIEQCDDGNLISNDACDTECSWTCKDIGKVDIQTNSFADGLIFHANNDPLDVEEGETSGEFLKIAGVMPTPYIWIANSKINDIPYNMITKMRAGHSGPPRRCTRSGDSVDCYWEYGAGIEAVGDVIGHYDVHGSDPSRTAVNVETGDVWIANRGSNNVTKLTIEGVHLKTCPVGGAPRGVAIEENGDVWVANSVGGTVMKLSGDDTTCTILETVNAGGYPYGLAIDSQNNVWLSDRDNAGNGKNPDGKIKKIDTSSDDFTITTYPPGSGSNINPYGITVDLDDNVWASYYYAGGNTAGIYKIDASTGNLTTHIFRDGISYYGRGITVDLTGQIWIAMDRRGVTKIFNPGDLRPGDNIPITNGYIGYNYSSVSREPVGVCGDSAGNVWVVNRKSNTVDVFNSAGNQIPGSPFTVATNSDTELYTYSDMTGINRAKVLRKGIWKKSFDAGVGGTGQHWGDVSWQQALPTRGSDPVEVEIRAYNEGDVEGTRWMSADDWNDFDFIAPERAGRYMEIKITMRSKEKDSSPVVWDLNIDCN